MFLPEQGRKQGHVPREISDIVAKKYIFITIPTKNSLNSDYNHFQVQKTEHLENEVVFVPLPLSGQSLSENVGQSSSSGPGTPAATLQNVSTTTPPSIGATSSKNQELRSSQNEAPGVTNTTQVTKRPATDDPPSGSYLKKSHVAKELFPVKDYVEDKALFTPKDSERAKTILQMSRT